MIEPTAARLNPATPPNLDAIRATVAELTEVGSDSPWDEDWLALAGQQLRQAVDELEQLRAENAGGGVA